MGPRISFDIKEKNDYPFVTNIHLVSPDRNFIWLIFDFISSFKYLDISSHVSVLAVLYLLLITFYY